MFWLMILELGGGCGWPEVSGDDKVGGSRPQTTNHNPTMAAEIGLSLYYR